MTLHRPHLLNTKPLRLWLPRLDAELAYNESKQDLKRARAVWSGQQTVWMVPWFERLRHWRIRDSALDRHVGVPSTWEEQIDVLHVSNTGYLLGNWQSRFTTPSLVGLLDSWLNYFSGGKKLAVQTVPEKYQYPMPEARGELIGYNDERVLDRRVGTYLPFTDSDGVILDDGARRVLPLTDKKPIFVEPDEEARALFGPSEFLNLGSGNRVGLSSDESESPSVAARAALRWEEPFDRLFPCGSGLSAVSCQAEMSRIAALSRKHHRRAIYDAQLVSADLLAPGSAAFRDVWLFQKIPEVGREGLLMEVEGRLDLAFSSIEEACESDAFQKKMAEIVQVQECFGALGLLWALFLDDLGDGRSFSLCERCGRLNRAQRSTKKYCDKPDDLQCYRARRSADRRRERRAQ